MGGLFETTYRDRNMAVIDDGATADPDILDDLVAANHILYRHKVVDAFGHVSVRNPADPDTFLISRSLAPALVRRDDILTLDFGGQPTGAETRSSYLERFIHAEIYRVRPDVNAVVHSHSRSVLPFAVSRDVPLQPVCHMCGFLPASVPLFEIRDYFGDQTDLLISNPDRGEALVKTLGGAAVVLMRGHGVTVVGERLAQAVSRAVYLEVNASVQREAMAMGDVIYLTEGEAAAAAAANDGQTLRAFDLWRLESAPMT